MSSSLLFPPVNLHVSGARCALSSFLSHPRFLLSSLPVPPEQGKAAGERTDSKFPHHDSQMWLNPEPAVQFRSISGGSWLGRPPGSSPGSRERQPQPAWRRLPEAGTLCASEAPALLAASEADGGEVPFLFHTEFINLGFFQNGTFPLSPVTHEPFATRRQTPCFSCPGARWWEKLPSLNPP